MSGKRSAGLLLFRITEAGTEVLIGHMGGPFWAGRDAGAWSIPKGEYGPEERAEAAARREFSEELGLPVPEGELIALGESLQSGGKIVTIWAVEADLDIDGAVFGTFTMEWPRGSGVLREFPELNRAAWCTPRSAHDRLVPGQRVFLDRLATHVQDNRPLPPTEPPAS